MHFKLFKNCARFAALALTSAAFLNTTQAAIVSQWDFNSGNLNATTGQNLEFFDGPGGETETQTVFGTTDTLGLPGVNGQPLHVMGFPRSLPTMGYLMHSDLPANGGGGMANQYTLIFDLLYTSTNATSWRGLIQIDDPSNANDADFFINPSGGIGISGSYQGVFASNVWQRVALSVDLANPAGPTVRKFIDGKFVGQQVLGAGVDGRWALNPAGGAFGDTVLLFTDNDATGGSEAPGYVSSIQVHDVALSDAYLLALGAPAGDSIPATVDIPVSLTFRQPGTNAVNIMPNSPVKLVLEEGSEPFDSSSVALKLNGQPLASTVTPDGAGHFTVDATLPNLASKSQNTLTAIWNDPVHGGSVTQQWSFSVAPYDLDPALAASLAKSLTAYWNLDEGKTNVNETVIHDIARDNNSVLTTSTPDTTWLTGSNAKFGSALYLDGSDAFVNVSTNDAMNIKTNEVTVSAWVKLDVLPSDMTEGIGGIYDSVEDSYVLYLDKGNRELRFKVTDSSNQAARPGIPQDLLTTGEWIHIAGVYNGNATTNAGDARIYINGQLADVHVGNDSTVGTGLKAMVRAGQVAAMGRNGAQAQSFLHGAVDDVAVWSRALTPDEIGYLASGHAVPVTGPVTAPAILSSRTPAPDAVNVVPSVPLEVVLSEGSEPLDTSKIVLRLNGTVLTPAITSQNGAVTVKASLAQITPNSENTVKVEWFDAALGAVVSSTWTFHSAQFGDDPQLAASLKNGMIAYWNMDEGLTNESTTTLEDTAGDNDAVLNLLDPTTAWLKNADARFGSALAVDGANTWADVPNTEALNITNNQVTVSVWVKLNELPNVQAETFAGIYDAVEDDYVVYSDKSNLELRFKVTDANGQAARPGIPLARLSTNTWLNVIAVYDGKAQATAGEARIYLNGQLSDTHVGSDSSPGTGLTGAVRAGQMAAIGRNGTQSLGFFNGAVDDIAIWDRALTLDEIGYIAGGHPAVSEAAASVSVKGISVQGQNVTITWEGGNGNYQLQRRASLSSGTWENVGAVTSDTQGQDTITGKSMFYRVLAQ